MYEIVSYSDADLAKYLPFPDAKANKYSRGLAVVLGGSSTYPGAAALASRAANRMGAGYVHAFCAPESKSVIQSFDPTIVATSWDAFREFSKESLSGKDKRALLVGSGMDGSNNFEKELLEQAIEEIECPLVIDGSAITYLSDKSLIEVACDYKNPLVVTPHFGEACRMGKGLQLTNIPLATDGDDHLASFAKSLSDGYQATIVLKSFDTYIASPNSAQVIKMSRGSVALAKAGSGDVLAGMIVSLLAQGLEEIHACILGTTLHAISALSATEKLTEICVDPVDVIDNIPSAIKMVSSSIS